VVAVVLGQQVVVAVDLAVAVTEEQMLIQQDQMVQLTLAVVVAELEEDQAILLVLLVDLV
jgi:hypothetical protein